LPYHRTGASKLARLGREDLLSRIATPRPSGCRSWPHSSPRRAEKPPSEGEAVNPRTTRLRQEALQDEIIGRTEHASF
jgi:hypothetical protein